MEYPATPAKISPVGGWWARRKVVIMEYRGDEAPGSLDAALRDAGVGSSKAEVEALIAGVAAAPPGYDADAWMDLIHPDAPPQLRALLRHQLGTARATLQQRPDDSGDRLAALRKELKRRRLAGFVVPRADQHQGEYVAEASERLRWLTSFTGSAGTAVVLLDAAALFIDGRYTQQARDEVDGAAFELRHVTHEPLNDWIATHLPARGRLGYDPWLHTRKQVLALERACSRAGGRAVPLDANLIDRIWTNRPPEPIAPVIVHDAVMAPGLGAAEKRQCVAATLASEGSDAAVLAQPDAIAWLLNIRGGDVAYAPLLLAFAILHKDASVELFCDPRKLTPRVRTHLGNGVAVAGMDAFAAALAKLGDSRARVRVDAERCPVWAVQQLQKAGARLEFADDPCLLPKAIKHEAELAAIREAHHIDGAALTRFLCWLAKSAPAGQVSEMAAAEQLERFRAEHPSYRGGSFPTISAAAGNGAIVHYRVTEATNRLLEPGSLYLVDSGGQYPAATTDVTRTVAVGSPSEEMRRRFTSVLQGHIALATAVFPHGTTGGQLDVLARMPLWRDGVDYDHGTGHGVGAFLCVHEGPQRISKMPNAVALQSGMILSNEPGYYKVGQFGIRIENLVAVVTAGAPEGAEQDLHAFETLTLAPIDRTLIDVALLSEKERAWVDAYHQRVRDTLTPRVDDETAVWLAEVTQPLR